MAMEAVGTVDAHTRTVRICIMFAACAITSCAAQPQATVSGAVGEPASRIMPAPSARPGRQPVEVEMRNVDLRVTSDVSLRIRHLRGRFVPSGHADIPYLDDKYTYVVAIDSGEIALGVASLNALMARTLGHGHSNVSKVRVSTDEERRLRQTGVLNKGIPLRFDVTGTVTATPDGRIRVHAAKVRSFGVTVTPIMKVFGIEMDDLLKVKPGHGVTVDDDDLILDPEQLLPAPFIRGKISSVRVTEDALVQTFGSGGKERLSPPAISKNYIYWRGGELQFGKLTMTQTDLELVDEDPSDPFDFSVDHWNEQLIAGYSKNTPSRGLKSHMPDYSDLHRRTVDH
jgi:hypothetical protein